MDETQKLNLAMHVSAVSIAATSPHRFKLAAGILAHSGAMLSDAVHSASDIMSTLVVMLGRARLVARARPRTPLRHERMECVAAVALAGVLC
jgi:divalent metal cation (Fe/Co/Zn/Cd) transporter